MHLSIPEDATARYAAWVNRLSDEQLYTQRFRECTLVHPSWFMARVIYGIFACMVSHSRCQIAWAAMMTEHCCPTTSSSSTSTSHSAVSF